MSGRGWVTVLLGVAVLVVSAFTWRHGHAAARPSSASVAPLAVAGAPPSGPRPAEAGVPASPLPSHIARYTPQPPQQRASLVQRLWLATVLGRKDLLSPPESSYFTDSSTNRDVLLALRRTVLGQPPAAADADVAVTLKYFKLHPDLLGRVLQTRLAFWCLGMRENPVSTDHGDDTCPMDASAKLYTDAAGRRHCPHENEESHNTYGMDGLMMLLDIMSRMREWDREPLARLAACTSGTRIVDIGAGVGAYSFPLARQVGPSGKVYAEDVQDPLVAFMAFKARELHADNVVPVLGAMDDIKIAPGAVDVALIIDVPASYENSQSFFSPKFSDSIHRALKTGGRLVIIGHPREPRASVYAALLKPHGFELVSSEVHNGREYVLLRRAR